jgi:hypothetical protein
MRLSWIGAAGLLVAGCGQSFSAGGGEGGAPDSSTGADVSTGAEGGSTEGGGSGADGGDACVPKTCPGLGYTCGVTADGCGKVIDCGTCPGANDVCDSTNHCTCKPITCAELQAQCGNVPDGCGGTLNCGTCEAGTCGGGGTLKCGSGSCVPMTCEAAGAQCGQIEDGCGNVVQCTDTCVAPQTCGGSGNATQCGCTGKTCTDLGWVCGTGDDGCGTTLSCGTCDGGTCDPNAHSCTCVPKVTCASQGWGCGSFTDTCNALETCGPAPAEQFTSTRCATDTQHLHFYTCCADVSAGGASGSDAGVAADAGAACNPAGPTPPESGMNCVALDTGGPPGWCCSQ